MRIGIITHYYNSKNYGGNLQAYALCKFLSNYAEAEQICYNNQNQNIESRTKRFLKNPFILLKAFKKIFAKVSKIANKKKIRKANECIKVRHNAMFEFNLSIPHSKVCYNNENINDCEKEYDMFVTGSDQVWHPGVMNVAYLLDFVSSKPKTSYAASITVKELSNVEKDKFKYSLKSYSAISVREKHAVELLKNLVDKKIEYVIDPVFLLSKGEWEKIASKRQVQNKYLFCYFLGSNKKSRKLAKEYAKLHDLKIVSIPYLNDKFRKCDYNFADYSLIDVSPNDFLSLIKHSEVIFTDSFHAVAFSNIFHKQYFIFDREKNGTLNERIIDVTKLFQTEERFCKKNARREKMQYLNNLKQINYEIENKELNDLVLFSKEFIYKNILMEVK